MKFSELFIFGNLFGEKMRSKNEMKFFTNCQFVRGSHDLFIDDVFLVLNTGNSFAILKDKRKKSMWRFMKARCW